VTRLKVEQIFQINYLAKHRPRCIEEWNASALEQFTPLGCHGTARRAHRFLADGYIREARERSGYRRHGARAISFRPDDRLVILTARIYNELRLSLLSARCPSRGLNDLRTIGLVAYHKSAGFTARAIFNNNNNGVTVIVAVSCIRFTIIINSLAALASIARGRFSFCAPRCPPEVPPIEFPVRYRTSPESLQ